MHETTMATANQTNLPEHGLVGGGRRNMTMTTPNPRRTPLTAPERTQDGRKRRKLSHSPEKESHAQDTLEIGNEVPRVLKSQESNSSDQSAGKWFSQANKDGLTSQQQSAELDGTLPAAVAPCKVRRC